MENEQNKPMQVGHVYLVRLQLDNEGRMVGTSRIERFLIHHDERPGPVRDREGLAPRFRGHRRSHSHRYGRGLIFGEKHLCSGHVSYPSRQPPPCS